MRLGSLVIALSILIGACASVPPDKGRPLVTLEPDSKPGYWRATWQLPSPTRELRFERTSNFRQRSFEVLTPGFVIEADGTHELLRTEGEPVSSVAVRFPELTEELEKDYDFFQKFADGSVAVYTGHLNARPAEACESCFVRVFRLVPPSGARVIAAGQASAQPVEWSDAEGQGTYVYFGSIAPVETAELISIIDPGLPQWLAAEMTTTLPRLFDLYTDRFDARLPGRPVVLFNYMDRGASGYSTGGGTLPGQIQLTADGAAWKERSDEALLHLFQFLAHESVHLWNGQLIHYQGTDDAWMHEGSADALAQRTLVELGVLDRSDFLDHQSQALNECRRKLGDFPLREAAARQQFPLYYSCGSALAFYTDLATEGDLFYFWRELIAHVRNSGRSLYDTADYYSVMGRRGASSEDVAQLRRFVEERASAEDLAAMLASRGARLVPAARPPQTFGQSVARDALLKLLTEHCTGEYGFTTTSDGFALKKTNNCGPIPAGTMVTAIGGHDVLRDGARAWDALHEGCGRDGVAMTIDDAGVQRTIGVPCSKAVPPPTPYLRIESLPGD